MTVLDTSEILDAEDWLALKALGQCAKLSVGDAARPHRHREFRQRALEIATRNRDALSSAILLANWTGIELSRGELGEAARLERLASDAIDLLGDGPDHPPLRAKFRETQARFLSHRAKLALRTATPDDGVRVLYEVNRNYTNAIDLIKPIDHLRVNLQIEHAQTLVELYRASGSVEVSVIANALDRALRGFDSHVCDDCRAYYHDVAARVERCRAEQSYNSDRAGAMRAWQAVLNERGEAIATYHRMKHHYAEDQRKLLAEEQAIVKRLERPRRIFLSHKSSDKARVRELADALALLGFEPWLDERDVAAGSQLTRSLLEGMNECCAVVFVLTPDFKDDGYLARELDHAEYLERDRKPWFKQIVIALQGSGSVEVPLLLKTFTYKRVESTLEALTEILKALPIEVGTVRWRDSVP